MGLNKKTIRQILLIIAFTVMLSALVIKFDAAWGAIKYFMRILSPIVMGFCLAFIINVLLYIVENKLFSKLNKYCGKIWRKLCRPLSLIVSIGILIGILFGLSFMIVPEISRTVEIISVNMPTYANQLTEWANNILSYFDMNLNDIINVQIDWNEAGKNIADFFKNQSGNLFNTTYGITSAIFGGVVNFVVAFVLSIYILLTKESLGKNTERMCRAFLPEKVFTKLFHISKLSYRVFSKFVTGQFTDAVVLGILCFIGMTIFGFPYATMISALIGFTALIPVVGAFLGIGVGAFLILMVDPIQALWFIVFILILQQIENNLIYPRIVGKSVGLPAIWVLIAVTVGGSAFGVMGMLIGVPTTSVIYCLIKETVSSRIGEDSETPSDDDDVPPKGISEELSDLYNTIRIKCGRLPKSFDKNLYKKK